ncbi:MAG TPA: transcription antitermination factor NusB [Streptosporangiaceae bacterium]|nr:transcription antitermination factor NusB [Streptosporangiaceae bacterium]
MAARSKARKRALDILFEADVRREPPLSVLEARIVQAERPVTPYAIELVQGVQAHREELDRLLGENSRGWTLDRMPAVDRNILRIGGYELLWGSEVPEAVAISEAVQLAGDLSTDGSAAFVNGLLARLLEIKPTLSGRAADTAPPAPGAA